MGKNKLLIKALIAVVLIGGVGFWLYNQNQPGKYDALAKCLREKGTKFYGAFWCPHCQNQKAMFGRSAKFLPYIECSTPDGRDQLPLCRDKNINGYPTWEFADGSRLAGEVPIDVLAEKSGCQI